MAQGSTLWVDFQAELAAKAAKDENFRRELLANPREISLIALL